MKFIDLKDGEMYYPKDILSVEHNNLKYIANQVKKINRRFFIYDLISITGTGLACLWLYKNLKPICAPEETNNKTEEFNDIPDDMPIE